MIKTFFQKASRPVRSRIEDLEEVKTQFSLIDRDKIATITDLEDCFFDNNTMFRGCVGAGHLLYLEQLENALQESINEGMFMQDIPASLAKEKTKDLLLSKACGRLVIKGFESYGLPEVERAIAREMEKYSRLQLVYVGDYLYHVEKYEKPRLCAAMDIAAGNTETLLRIIQDLQELPDYSEYAHHDRPPPMQGKNQDDREKRSTPSWQPAFNV